jgi:dynein heavy chain
MQISSITEKPEDGCIIHGMFLEGARWDSVKHIINHSKPKELFTDFPTMHLMPVMDRQVPTENIYEIPVYKVVSRKGTLMTTGHSTNFVMMFELATKEHKDVWIRAGVAGFISLRY